MKQFFINLNMLRKLLAAPLIIIIFLLVFGLVSYGGILNQRHAIDDIFNTRFKDYQSCANIVGDIT